MLEKFLLAATITFSLNLFIGGHLPSHSQVSNSAQLATQFIPFDGAPIAQSFRD